MRVIFMKNSKLLFVFSLLVLMILVACGGGDESADAEKVSETDDVDGATELTHWAFAEKHSGVIIKLAESWNRENPDRPIKLISEVFPVDQMTNNLLLALQSGKGAPDIADIEISRFSDFLKGEPQLLTMNEYVEPYLDKIVLPRYENYSKDGNYYGLPLHVGASVMYYNKEIMEKAGVDIDSIVTWDDFAEAGKLVVQNTDSVMTTFETADYLGFWAMISQQDSDFIDDEGNLILNNETNIKTLEFMLDMIKEGT